MPPPAMGKFVVKTAGAEQDMQLKGRGDNVLEELTRGKFRARRA